MTGPRIQLEVIPLYPNVPPPLLSSPLTAQVQKAAIAAFKAIPTASWSTFVTQYGGNVGDTDGAYQAITAAVAPVNGTLWTLLLAYLQTIGQSTAQAALILTAIWAAAPNQPV